MADSDSPEPDPSKLHWVDDETEVDWNELSDLYLIAPLGKKPASDLALVFANSMYKTFVYNHDQLIGTGRVLADGLDCAYIADVAVHPEQQGKGIGAAIIRRLSSAAKHHKKIILYANPGTEPFYLKLGFLQMNTAMAIWRDPDAGIESGVLRGPV